MLVGKGERENREKGLRTYRKGTPGREEGDVLDSWLVGEWDFEDSCEVHRFAIGWRFRIRICVHTCITCIHGPSHVPLCYKERRREENVHARMNDICLFKERYNAATLSKEC